jgi:hypothetical protein
MIIPGAKAALGGLEGSTKWNREMGKLQAQNRSHSSSAVTGGVGDESGKKNTEEREEGGLGGREVDVGKWNN